MNVHEASAFFEKPLIPRFQPPMQECPFVFLPPASVEWTVNLSCAFDGVISMPIAPPAQFHIKAAFPASHSEYTGSSVMVVTVGGEMVPTQLTISVSACTASGLFTMTRLGLVRSTTAPPYPYKTSTKLHTSPSYCCPCQT